MSIGLVIIMIGPSGSGKSTWAVNKQNILCQQGKDCRVVSADYFMINPLSGAYEFQPSKLGMAHDICKIRFVEALAQNCHTVIVDNTNTTTAERFFYYRVAEIFGYDVEYRKPGTEWQDNIEECHKRNVHSVPKDVVAAQMKRICENPAESQ